MDEVRVAGIEIEADFSPAGAGPSLCLDSIVFRIAYVTADSGRKVVRASLVSYHATDPPFHPLGTDTLTLAAAAQQLAKRCCLQLLGVQSLAQQVDGPYGPCAIQSVHH